ncbi:hypothetical protein HY572_01240 [Candidatus Micrarchaeota archaeon]|nr:hypothetical protein [Candidatus Micrarchaeota archaeon]
MSDLTTILVRGEEKKMLEDARNKLIGAGTDRLPKPVINHLKRQGFDEEKIKKLTRGVIVSIGSAAIEYLLEQDQEEKV